MDRTTGANFITSGGKRQFTDGPPGTAVDEGFLNAIQEEIMNVIEGAGIAPSSSVFTQLREGIFATVSAGGFFNVPAIGLSVGNGGEGAYVSAGNAVLEGEHHYTDFTLNSAHQLSVGSTGILIIRCTGTATINGSVNGNGLNGTGAGGGGAGGGGGGGLQASTASTGGAGGGLFSNGTNAGNLGGSGKTNVLTYNLWPGIRGGSGGSSGSVVAYPGGAGGGSNAFSVSEWSICSLLSLGIFPAGGGGGGGAARYAGFPTGGGGGGGGCFILIVAPTITGTGTVSSNGGAGLSGSYTGASTDAGGGGGGGGGVVILVSKVNPSDISIAANGGSGGTGSAVHPGQSGTNGFTKKYYPGA